MNQGSVAIQLGQAAVPDRSDAGGADRRRLLPQPALLVILAVDRIGRKKVIWGSILGELPFTLALPYAGLATAVGLSVAIGLVLSSAFPAIARSRRKWCRAVSAWSQACSSGWPLD